MTTRENELLFRLAWIRERLVVIDRELAEARHAGKDRSNVAASKIGALFKERNRLVAESERLTDKIARD
jgi:hypothetical protein